MQTYCVRRICLTPRLFQQACRASTKTRARPAAVTRLPRRSTQKPLPAQQPFRKVDSEDDASIRWFQKDVKTGKIKRTRGDPEELEADDLRHQIKQLQDELRSYETDEFGQGFNEAMLEALEPHERQKVEIALREQSERKLALTDGLDLKVEFDPLIEPSLKRLNASLKTAAVTPTSPTARRELWRWYRRTKHSLPSLASMMPPKAWEVLFRAQSVKSISNPDGNSHILEMSNDMEAAGVTLSNEQRSVRLNSMLGLGMAKEAEIEWDADYKASAGRDMAVVERGIMLFDTSGDSERSMDLLREYFTRSGMEADPRLVVPSIAANARKGNSSIAYALYVLMRSKLRVQMQMSDYDAVISVFLDNNRTAMALAVFRDMMMQGARAREIGAVHGEQELLLMQGMQERIQGFFNHSATIDDINKVSLDAVSILPRQWQNKFFYGSWIKKLIGTGDVHGASKVIELMYERGVEPDAKHMNGIVGAWLRSGEPEQQDKGEQLAWSMISKRLDRVEARRDKGAFEPSTTARRVPMATRETFNVMAMHYLIKEEWAKLRQLQQQLRAAQIPMDAFFMNQLLYSQLYSGGGSKPTWDEFIEHARYVRPDIETFNCLWTAALRQMRPVPAQRGSEQTKYLMPRRLFTTMMIWRQELDERHLGQAAADFSSDLYSKIITTFCMIDDYAGCLVAMHAVADAFGFFPDPAVTTLLTDAMSNLSASWTSTVPTVRGRGGRKPVAMNAKRIQAVNKVLKILQERRVAAAREQGVYVDESEKRAVEKYRERLNLLSEMIRVVLLRLGGTPDAIEQSIVRTSEELGVPGISTGDVDASNVI